MWLYLVNIYTDVGEFEMLLLAMAVAIFGLGYLLAFTIFAAGERRRPRRRE